MLYGQACNRRAEDGLISAHPQPETAEISNSSIPMPLVHGQEIGATEIEREVSGCDPVRFARLFNAVAWASTWPNAKALGHSGSTRKPPIRQTTKKPADRAGLILSSRCLGYCDAHQHRGQHDPPEYRAGSSDPTQRPFSKKVATD